MKRAARIACACTGTLVALTAFAGTTRADDAAAAQFQLGLDQMQTGRYATACPLLAESYRLDPRPGVLFTLAECEARWPRPASALTHYEAYLRRVEAMPPDQRGSQKERIEVAGQQVARLRASTPKLVVAVSPRVPEGAVVLVDGAPLNAAELGVERPVDPGAHQVTVRAADGRTRVSSVTSADAGTERVIVDVSSWIPSGSQAAPAVAPTQPAREASGRTTTWPLWALGGTTVAGVAVGAIAGILVLGEKSTIDAHCADVACDADGKRAADGAKTLAAVSTVGFVVGGAAAIAFGAVWLAGRSDPPKAAWRVIVGPGSAGVSRAF